MMLTFGTDAALHPVLFGDDARSLRLIDQRKLPGELVWVELRELEAVAQAIEDLVVRGAPAIGCAAAMGFAAISHDFPDAPVAFDQAAAAAVERLADTRPTAVNLFVALDEMRAVVAATAGRNAATRREALVAAARAHAEKDFAACQQIGAHGAALMPKRGGVLTHCNTGALATAGWGTALGVIRSAHAKGHELRVFVDETRPVLQGSRLTAWELMQEGIDMRLITDSMAAAVMRAGEVEAVIVGADRIAANGDTANKIGTYGLAVLAAHHDVPFYVAAPWTTVDLNLACGDQIEIETRDAEEVRLHGGARLSPAGVEVFNPAFDVTPAGLITKIITQTGAYAPAELAGAAPTRG